MKKTILILTTILFLASCGSKMSKEDQAKLVIHTIDSLNTKLEAQANDYCKCLETKSTKDCQSIYLDLCTTYDSASSKTRDAAYSGMITKEENERLHKATGKQFDRKAECAKAAMRRDGN